MGNLFDYLAWRGDLSMTQSPFNAVDNLICSTLIYIHFQAVISSDMTAPITVGQACSTFLALPIQQQKLRVRIKNDIILAEKLINCPRFSNIPLVFHRDELDRKTEMQFAGLAFLLEDGSAFVSYRGTDNSLVAWKEDFNMTFQAVIPAQLAALQYLKEFSAVFGGDIRVGGHSKGGNLAIYATTNAPPSVRNRIIEVYNNDGPGFFPAFLERAEYAEILPRIKTYTPQSSLVGMMLEHEEPHTVIHSHELGPLQHDPYSWSVLGANFIQVDGITHGSRLVDRTLKAWLEGLSNEEREAFVEAIYEIFTQNNLLELRDLKSPKGIYTVLKSLHREDDETKQMISKTLGILGRSLGQAMRGGEIVPTEAISTAPLNSTILSIGDK